MPKLIATIFSMIIISLTSHSQFTLTAPNGKKVQLSENGTWKYLDNQSKQAGAANKAKYVSKYKKYCVNYDPKFWSYDSDKAEDNTWDVTFHSQDNATSAYCIEYRLSYGAANLDSISRSGYEPMGKLTSFNGYDEVINGLTVRSFEAELTFNEIDYKYKGFIHNSKAGTFQFSVGTQKNVFEEDLEKINELLHGFAQNK